MADPLRLNLRGRLRNFTLPASSALVPVFEAVINGLHAIAESKRKDGRITIEILRKGQLSLESGGSEPIHAFAIEDNGVGFNEENYDSFLESDTLKKAKLGGRGVGRLTWAKAFRRSRIDSTYLAKDGGLHRRRFIFSADGITDDSDEPVAPGNEGTRVVLEEMDPVFFKQLPKTADTIGERMVDHFLVALRGSEARVVITDMDETFDVTAEIERILRTSKTSTVIVQGASFKVTHVKIASGDNRAHRLAYLANHRLVKSENLEKWIPQLRARLSDAAGTKFWSLALAESEALDGAVSAERDTFHFPEEPDTLLAEQELSMSAIRSAIMPTILETLNEYLAPLRDRAVEQAKEYAENEAPQYRSILTAKREAVEALPPDLGKEKLDVELRRIRFQHEQDLRERASAVLRDDGEHASAYDELLTATNAAAIDDLAKYVKARRVILDLMRKAVRTNVSGKFSLEEAIHKLVLPMRTTSDDIPYEQMNLWLIDERLAFHSYLASDKPFTSIAPVQSESRDRPDLIVFNRPIAFAEDAASPLSQSVVIVEFKRPMREEYDEKENPIAQVYAYVREVRGGTARQRDGRPLKVPHAMPCYCYVVCDLTEKLRVFAENAALTQASDQQGYFGYNGGLHAYVEVISFDKLINDAEKRNRIFFEKLGLPRPR